MFHRSQDKQQGFAKEQRVADAQLASLRQLGLLSPEKRGFSTAWGGTDLIASISSRPSSRKGPKPSSNNISAAVGGDPSERTFPEKGELTLSPLLFVALSWPHPVHVTRLLHVTHQFKQPRDFGSPEVL